MVSHGAEKETGEVMRGMAEHVRMAEMENGMRAKKDILGVVQPAALCQRIVMTLQFLRYM
jgi:hypothetical protein